MKTIYIVGGDGFARECYFHLKKVMENDSSITFGGFLGFENLDNKVTYPQFEEFYRGDVSLFNFNENDFAIIGAGNLKFRKKIYDYLSSRNVAFYTLISVDSQLSEFTDYGEANIFYGCRTTVNVSIGKGNIFNGNVLIGHDVTIGDFNFVGPNSLCLGNTIIGENNLLGASSILLPKARIGNNNIICPMSVVYKGCRNNSYLQGNPAIKIKNLSEGDEAK